MKRWWLCLLLLGLAPLKVGAAEKHALLIGIDDYANNIRPLAAASADVNSLADTLKRVGQWKPQNVRVLTSQSTLKPTRAQIIQELTLLAKQVRPDDVVFILYSGHGIELGGQSYLVPADANPATAQTLKTTCVAAQTFHEQLKSLPAQGVILAFDMCRNAPFEENSRSLASTTQLSSGLSRDLVLVPAGRGPRSAITLFSCRVGEKSWEWRDKKRGYFSYFLEQGLREGAADETGKVKMGALMAYLEETVPVAVQVTEKQTQTPWSELRGSGGASLVLATVPTTERPVEPNTALSGTSYTEQLNETRKAVVERLSQLLIQHSNARGRINGKLIRGSFEQKWRVSQLDRFALILMRNNTPLHDCNGPLLSIETAVPLLYVDLAKLKVVAPTKRLPFVYLNVRTKNDARRIRFRVATGSQPAREAFQDRGATYSIAIPCTNRAGGEEIAREIRKLVVLSRMLA